MKSLRVFFLLIFIFTFNSSLKASFLGFSFETEASRQQKIRGVFWLGGANLISYRPLAPRSSSRGLSQAAFGDLASVVDAAAAAWEQEQRLLQEELRQVKKEKEEARAAKKRAQRRARKQRKKQKKREEAEAARELEEEKKEARKLAEKQRLAQEEARRQGEEKRLAEEEEIRKVLESAKLAEEAEAEAKKEAEIKAKKEAEVKAKKEAEARRLDKERKKRAELRRKSGSPWGVPTSSSSSSTKAPVVDFRGLLEEEKEQQASNQKPSQEASKTPGKAVTRNPFRTPEKRAQRPELLEERAQSPELIAQKERKKERVKKVTESPDTVLSLKPWAKTYTEEECDREFRLLKERHLANPWDMRTLEEKTAFFTKKILNPFFAEKPTLRLVLNGGYLVRYYAQGSHEHYTDDVDLLLVDEKILRKKGEPDFNEVRTALQSYFYTHREELGQEEAYRYDVCSDPEYGIKVAYRNRQGHLKALMDIGFSEKAYEKIVKMGLCRDHDKELEERFSVPCTLLKFEAYQLDLEDRVWQFLDPESELSRKYKHKLPSWKSQLYTLYSLQWGTLSLKEKIYFLDLYRKLSPPSSPINS